MWWWSELAAVAVTAVAAADDGSQSTVSSTQGKLPAGYVPPLLSNGSLSLLLDWTGGQAQQAYCGMTPGIWWAGRRYGPPKDQLVPFGHFRHEVAAGGQVLAPQGAWAQTLDTREATVACRNEYGDAVSVETLAFTPLDHDLIVIRQRVTAKDADLRAARLTFRYQFTPPGDETRFTRRIACTAAVDEASQSAELRYQADTYPPCQGVIGAFADQPVTAAVDGRVATLTADLRLDPARPAEVTFFLLFVDSLDGPDYLARAAALRDRARQQGWSGLLDEHRRAWAAYWDDSFVRLPDPPLQKMYCTAQYHLRANATKWSFPVGIFSTHWAGRYFGWDEMFCYQALISSNHREVARRCPDFRLAALPKALQRASHYGKPGLYGARYPWETLEDGSEAAPPGFWLDHVFHMSNIAVSAWFQYLYTHDADYLRTTGYPIVRECARFFRANLVYEGPDGSMFIGKCTDLERLGPARLNPFMTSCGAIFTLEAAAAAAAIVGEQADEAAAWRHAAARLRESLPHDGQKYVPYAGCQERSIASLGGLFPYPLFDATNERQRLAALDFVAEGRASGNMYPVGNAVCAWYAGWMAAALAELGEQTEPAKLLAEAAAGAGCFGEMFEIHEAAVAMHPWFATASGNVVYALNQMLLQSRGDEIRLAAGVPAAWEQYAFKLAAHGDLVVEAAVSGGRLERLALIPGNAETTHERTLVVPARLLDGVALRRDTVTAVAGEGPYRRLTVRCRGRADVL